MITAKAIDVDRIGYLNCTRSDNFRAEIYPEESVGIDIMIAESHILPFTMEQPEAMGALHQDIENMNDGLFNETAGRLYDQNPKKNTKFSYSCAELFYEGYHKAQQKNGKLDESKVWAKALGIERSF